jgi:RNA recognition motif-containing protein
MKTPCTKFIFKSILAICDTIITHFRKDDVPPSYSLDGGTLFPKGEEMETKLYVGNLSYDTTEDELRELFSKAGTVNAVDLIKDRDSGTSKGFAFVTMNSQEEANQAIQQVNGQSLGNRELRVSIARPREERSGGGGYGGGGGRGGGGGGYGDRRGGSGGGGGNRDRRGGSGGGNRRY